MRPETPVKKKTETGKHISKKVLISQWKVLEPNLPIKGVYPFQEWVSVNTLTVYICWLGGAYRKCVLSLNIGVDQEEQLLEQSIILLTNRRSGQHIFIVATISTSSLCITYITTMLLLCPEISC